MTAFFTNHVGQLEICPSTGNCYAPGDALGTAFVAYNADTAWGVVSGVNGGSPVWHLDPSIPFGDGWSVFGGESGVTPYIEVETVDAICTPGADMDIEVQVAIVNGNGYPMMPFQLPLTLRNDVGDVLSSAGDSFPASCTAWTLTVPAGTTGKIRIRLAADYLSSTYEDLIICSVDLAP